MKKISILFFGTAISLSGFAQNSKVTSAVMNLEQYNEKRDSNDLITAKQAIDLAAVNDKTKDEPKMYLYRGEVYTAYFSKQLGNMVSKALAAGDKNVAKINGDAYTNIDTNSICIAANSFVKVIQLGTKDSYADEAREQKNLPTCLVYLENKALREYYATRYATSLALYEKIILILNTLNKTTDSTYKENIEMAANSAGSAGNTALALMYYQKMIDLKYGGATPYRSLSNMYLKQNDSVKAWDYIEKGRTQFPDDLNLIISETNFYITKHDYEKAEGNLTLTINKVEQRPDKDKNKALLASLYSNLGGIYDHKANPKDAQGKDLAKPANYADLLTKADSNYQKALALTPDDFDLLYNIGVLYFNQALPLNNQANALPLSAKDKYNKLMNEAKADFLKAQPYFERAYKINSKDAANNNALMQVYASTDQTDKAEAMKANK